MSWGPVRPAAIAFNDGAAPNTPMAADFGDVYHARQGALAQARHVFLAGNGLPQRWQGRSRFVVLETGFGLGHNFLATWAAWRADALRAQRLVFVSLEKHPPRRDDLARALAVHDGDAGLAPLAQQLIAAWPPLTPDLHTLDFEGGAVRLLLALGDIAQVLPELQLQADAFYLDGFAPARNPAMWEPHQLQRLARLAAPEATLATWCVAGAVRRALAEAGFVVQRTPGFAGKREMTVGRFEPRHVPPPPPGRRAQPGLRRVAVIGAGLAGAAAARALAQAQPGLELQLFERREAPAQETSGNAGGLFHGIAHGQDGPHARWLRAGALRMARLAAPLLASGRVAGALDGLMRGAAGADAASMQALLEGQGLPPEYLQLARWPGGAASGQPAWCYPTAGWLAPGDIVRAWLDDAGIALHCGTAVDRLQRDADGRWRLWCADGQCLAEADAVVLTNAADALRLLAGLGLPGETAWTTGLQRGQTTLVATDAAAPALAQPLAAGGYALRLDAQRLLCGATSQAGDLDPQLRQADQAANLATLQRLTGWSPAAAPALQGRVGWRFVTDDRLPLIGPVPLAAPRGPRLEQPRQVPREPGLWLLTALGSRGLSQAALAGELLAAWMTGTPWPVPAALADAVDPARYVSRARREAARRAG